ncbi:MAG: hypothetical protein RBS24_01840 [Bacilli bacterium]|nr:hypothetical protein [Bacilli bacterium]
MVIIKIYSQDMYVATEISIHHAKSIAALLKIKETDVFLVGSEGTLVAEGVDQVSWFTYLEVSLPEPLAIKQNELSTLLHDIFTNYGVHIMIKYDYYRPNNLVKILNPDFKVFNETMVEVITNENYYGDEDDDDNWGEE